MRILLLCLFLTGCYSNEFRYLQRRSNTALNKIHELEEHARYLEDEQDVLSDAIDELKEGQKLIELEDGPCPKCEPKPAILMGPPEPRPRRIELNLRPR